MGATYDKAAAALARYGQHRVGIEEVIARRPDAANLSAKFEQMDAQIGEAAATAKPWWTTWRRRPPSCSTAPSTPSGPPSAGRRWQKQPHAPHRHRR
jgi:hypothetical protein